VTFVNPVPEKGVEKALAIAALCPDIPFRFVKAWRLASKAASQLERKINSLANVDLVERSRDMRTIYRETKILLVPSQCAETWGRVATEAHYSGIPILASRVGALPESVGPGGILVDPEAPACVWADELKQMWHNDWLYERMRDAALCYSTRSQIAASQQIEALLSVIHSVVSGRFVSC
jgi:glycosyltransferase involved in cell wall biosynthesis